MTQSRRGGQGVWTPLRPSAGKSQALYASLEKLVRTHLKKKKNPGPPPHPDRIFWIGACLGFILQITKKDISEYGQQMSLS